MPGPLPKETHQRERDTKRRITNQQILVSRTEAVHVPTIAEATGRSDWSAPTLAYWQTWSTSPQAQAFEATDWQRLAMLVPLVETFWTIGGAKDLLGEIRLSEERLGATVADRQRLRMKVEEAASAVVLQLVPDGETDDDLRA